MHVAVNATVKIVASDVFIRATRIIPNYSYRSGSSIVSFSGFLQ
jgi:hypothetical protein